MASTIKLKNGSGEPLASDLVAGEPAFDLTNKRLYTEDSGGTVIEVGTNPTSLTTGDITTTGAVDVTGDLDVDNINIDGNTISSTDTDGDITLDPNGTGVVDVTGTVTADGLTVDGDFVQRVSLGNATSTFHADTNASPVVTLELQRGTNDTWGADAYGDYRLQLTAGDLNFDSAESGVTSTRATFGANGDISFYDTSANQAFYWDATNARLGLGTGSSPNYPLDVDVTAPAADDSYKDIFFAGMAGAGGLSGEAFRSATTGSRNFSLQAYSQNSANAGTNYADLVINKDGGNVGIGTSSPDTPLHVKSPNSAQTDAETVLSIGGNGDWTTGGAVKLYMSGIDSDNRGAYIQSEITSGGNAHDLSFGVSANGATPSEAMRIDSSGNLDLTNGGGNIIMASGAGIDFSATANSPNGTMSNELLDDYEEGTWTAGVSQGTIVSANGYYRKVGSLVTVYVFVSTFSDRSTAQNINITGLPFAQDTGADDNCVGSCMWRNVDEEVQGVYINGFGNLECYGSPTGTYDGLKYADLNSTDSSGYITATYIAA